MSANPQQTSQTPRLDLDILAPADREIVYKGETYLLPGEHPIETVIRSVQIDERIELAGNVDELEAALLAQREFANELLRVRQPKLKPLPFTARESGQVIAFATAVKPNTADPSKRTSDDVAAELTDGAAEGEDGPPTIPSSRARRPKESRSQKRSPSASSV